MTKYQKEIIKKMLNGHYLRKMASFSTGNDYYRLYDEKCNPTAKVSERSIRKVDRFLEGDIFKKDKIGRIVLNLSVIRKIDGRNAIKKMYKKKLKEKKQLNQEAAHGN